MARLMAASVVALLALASGEEQEECHSTPPPLWQAPAPEPAERTDGNWTKTGELEADPAHMNHQAPAPTPPSQNPSPAPAPQRAERADGNPLGNPGTKAGECGANPGPKKHQAPAPPPPSQTPPPAQARQLAECADDNPLCSAWAKAGECERNSEFMKQSCQQSCGFCLFSEPGPVLPSAPPSPASTQQPLQCADDNPLCGAWAKAGECERNSEFMKQRCRQSCGLCQHPASVSSPSSRLPSPAPGQQAAKCADGNPQCNSWARAGECESNAEFMTQRCRQSCGLCPLLAQVPSLSSPLPSEALAPQSWECADGHSQCNAWATAGECEGNPAFMKLACRRSCGHCRHLVTLPFAAWSPSSTAHAPQLEECADHDPQCSAWSKAGECERNLVFMTQTCRQSCGFCAHLAPIHSRPSPPPPPSRELAAPQSAGCTDGDPQCNGWARTGECELYPLFMKWMCRQSCGLCPHLQPVPLPPSPYASPSSAPRPAACANETPQCSAWAHAGECERNSEIMKRMCRQSCGLCLHQAPLVAPVFAELATPVSSTSLATRLELLALLVGSALLAGLRCNMVRAQQRMMAAQAQAPERAMASQAAEVVALPVRLELEPVAVATFECTLCAQQRSVDGSFTAECDHRFCYDCIRDDVVSNIVDGKVDESFPRCVICSKSFTAHEVIGILESSGLEDLKAQFLELRHNAFLAAEMD